MSRFFLILLLAFSAPKHVWGQDSDISELEELEKELELLEQEQIGDVPDFSEEASDISDFEVPESAGQEVVEDIDAAADAAPKPKVDAADDFLLEDSAPEVSDTGEDAFAKGKELDTGFAESPEQEKPSNKMQESDFAEAPAEAESASPGEFELSEEAVDVQDAQADPFVQAAPLEDDFAKEAAAAEQSLQEAESDLDAAFSEELESELDFDFEDEGFEEEGFSEEELAEEGFAPVEDFAEDFSQTEEAAEETFEEGFEDEGFEAAEDFAEQAPEPEPEPVAEDFIEEDGLQQDDMLSMPAEPSVVEDAPIVDEPNRRKEKEIFYSYQYIKSNNDGGNEWSYATAGRDSEVYNIQAGDNLWDISLTLFGNPYFWAKIWSLNSRITNPHAIQPNDKLLFVEGSIDEVPMLTDAEMGGQDVLIVEEQMSEEEKAAAELQAKLPQIPSSPQRRPTLKNIPPSLAAWDKTDQYKDDFGIGKLSKVILDLEDVYTLRSYISPSKPESLGEIVEIEGGMNTANLYQYVYVKSDQVQSGQTYSVTRIRDEIENLEGDEIGYAIRFEGEISIIERVNPEKPIYKAIVKYVNFPVSKGSSISSSAIPRVVLKPSAPMMNTQANIIGGDFDRSRKVLAEGSIVYLDKGLEAGIRANQRMQIIKNIAARRSKTEIKSDTDVIGMLYVVDVKENLSTAIIMDSADNIILGDRTGSAVIMSYGGEAQDIEDGFESDFESDFEDDFAEEFSDEFSEDFESDF